MRLLVFLFLMPFAAMCQRFSGNWLGRFHSDMFHPQQVYRFELRLEQEGDRVWGVYRTIDTLWKVPNVCTCTVQGTIDRRDSGFVRLFRDAVVDTRNVPLPFCAFLRWLDVEYLRTGTQQFVRGRWFHGSVPSPNRYDDANGSFELERVSETTFQLPQPDEKPLVAVSEPIPVEERVRSVAAIWDVDTLQAELLLYDNGTVDGDSVTVYLNDRPVVAALALVSQPQRIVLRLEPGRDNELIVAALNLGSIPPNTGRMVLRAGAKRYELPIATSLQRNALILLRAKGNESR